eukprot:Gregarina_sp_Poly_1__7279@NODE_3_length_27868_cov_154_961188_g2_i0_p16_GENE_NODE_3_length_27868_cov_154_961188_g2_i0NODE_3_length_27868_cov_154_961188_g2_i0_p16_ORF_typecomplete_len147_score0_07Steroid_dh/PF02544_16/1_5e16DUF1295/PF06966_12/5_8e05NDUF_C2/PF06374_11/17NDUF_C2/PF06374_11/0_14TMEM220/PF15071_6/1e02TMEM220/PF15071_6/0_046Herpes_LMP1/PF05297_11/0_025DUF3487/PF11990_8/2_3DUF3487/PF11990_8/67DUF4131/PF13567_6/13DUF4131/PF13567_6/11DUF805/PF05656_14/0_5DUF805/PF05656_14/1_3e02_NODE_3_le
MSAPAYALGLLFYIIAPISISIGNNPKRRPTYLVIVVMLVGSLVQMVAHNYLIALRRLHPTGYAIPRHWVFRYTWFPHYWCEFVLYFCIAISRRNRETYWMCAAVALVLATNGWNQKPYYARLLLHEQKRQNVCG